MYVQNSFRCHGTMIQSSQSCTQLISRVRTPQRPDTGGVVHTSCACGIVTSCTSVLPFATGSSASAGCSSASSGMGCDAVRGAAIARNYKNAQQQIFGTVWAGVTGATLLWQERPAPLYETCYDARSGTVGYTPLNTCA